MEDVLSIDSSSQLSSMADPPSHLERQYSPLTPVFQGHGTELPHRGSPDSNSEAMISALRALQDKIRGLELERVTAARKFQDLAEETDRHTRSTQTPLPTTTSSHSSPPPYASPSGQDTEDLRSRLDSIDTKLTVQARTLDSLRHGMEQADTSQHRLLGQYVRQRQTGAVERRRSGLGTETTCPSSETHTEDKVRQLEMEHARLASGHSLTQSKLKDLEHRLLAEQWHRRQLQGRTPKGTSDVDRGPPKAKGTRPKLPSKKRKKTIRSGCQCTCGLGPGIGVSGGVPVCRCRPVPGVHYRLDMRDIPFIIGTSTAPSHSVPANYQQLLAKMKAHSPLLCGAVAASRGYSAPGKKAPPSESKAELKSLLAGLDEEFGRLTFEHQELAKRINESRDPQSTADLEKQFENLVDTMETKSAQIKIVQKQLNVSRRQPAKPRPCRHPVSLTLPPPAAGEGFRTPGVPKSPSLDFLQKMKTLQSTLQRDDLTWD